MSFFDKRTPAEKAKEQVCLLKKFFEKKLNSTIFSILNQARSISRQIRQEKRQLDRQINRNYPISFYKQN